MAAGLDELRGIRSSINVTPLIDVLLVLLIIFIMLTPVLTKALHSEIPRKLDQPLPAEYAKRQLVVHLCADGRLLLNREEVESESLAQRLRTIFTQRGGRRVVFLDADKEVVYDRVMEVMDLCRDGGVQTIGVIPDSIGQALAGEP